MSIEAFTRPEEADMRKRTSIVVAGVVVVALIGGIAAVAMAKSDEPAATDAPRSITVSSTATVGSAPDEAIVSFGISTEDPDPTAAYDRNGVTTNAVIDALKGAGLTEDVLETTNVSLDRITRRRDGERHTTFVARVRIQVTITDLDSVGKIIQTGIRAGANQVEGVSFQVSDVTGARTDALQQAVEGARKKADALAGAADEHVTGVLEIHEENNYSRPYAYPAALAGFAAASDEALRIIPPDEIKTSETVTVVWSLD